MIAFVVGLLAAMINLVAYATLGNPVSIVAAIGCIGIGVMALLVER